MIHTLTLQREITVTKLALTGKFRSGKDEFAKRLYLAHDFERVAFGDELKRTLYEVFPWQQFAAQKPRRLLQQYGQIMRQLDPDVWVRHVERRVDGIINLNANIGREKFGVVVTDLRQQNEYDWCRANGFTVIRVTAPDEVRIGRARSAGDEFSDADLTHETESAIDGFAVDAEVINDGSVEDLKAKVDTIVEAIQ